MPITSADLFPPALTMPPGFDYCREIIDRAEEAALVAEIATLDFAPYEFRGVQARRRVVAYGFPSPEIPQFLHGLRSRVAAFAGLPAADFAQALVSEYSVGTPIGWHRDRPHYNTIAGVSLLGPATLRLRKEEGGRWLRSSLTLEPRSAYILSGAVRNDWQHSIPAVEALRYSVTFRTLRV